MFKYLLCTAGGVGIGYFIAQSRLEKLYLERLNRADEEARDFYRRKYQKQAEEQGEDAGLTEDAIRTAETLRDYQGLSVGPEVLVEHLTESMRNLEDIEALTNPVVREKMMEEASKQDTPRVPSGPVNYNKISTPVGVEKTTEVNLEPAVPSSQEITAEEFISNERDYKQASLTYYSGDDILADEREEILRGDVRAAALTPDVLRQLKEGLGEKDAIYVRSSDYEYEIIRSVGSYTDEVGPIEQSG